jgi:hypothetical protein
MITIEEMNSWLEKNTLKWINIFLFLDTPYLWRNCVSFTTCAAMAPLSFLPDIAQLLNCLWRLCWNNADRLIGHKYEGICIYIYIYIYICTRWLVCPVYILFILRYVGPLIRSQHWPHVYLRIMKQQVQLPSLPPYSAYMSFYLPHYVFVFFVLFNVTYSVS